MKKDAEYFRQFINRQTWTFAKTMPESPHFYIVKGKLSEDEQKIFEEFVTFIRLTGTPKKYKKATYIHFYLNGWSYWTMGAPLDQTTIINRHKISFYDQVADVYDKTFSDEKSLAENFDIARLIEPFLKGEVLDVGCGTGLLLDVTDGSKYAYTGIDPSRKMLEKLKEKHSSAETIATTFEDLADFLQFDAIVSLFGSVSYIDPAMFGKFRAMLKPGGKYFLMFFKPDYFPLTYQRTGKVFSHYKTDTEQLKRHFEHTFEYSNYVCATNIDLD